MITFVTHFWDWKYPLDHVRKLYAGLQRHMKSPWRFIVVTDAMWRFNDDPFETFPIWDMELTQLKGCVVRLRIFDQDWQQSVGITEGEIICSVDIDLIVTGGLEPLFRDFKGFTILQNVNTTNPCPYNGSIFAFRAGTNSTVWHDYTPEANAKVPFHSFPDDQGWLHHKLPRAAAWGPSQGVYAFKKRGWPSGDDLPYNARIVAFPGWRDPAKPEFAKLTWIKEHWKL